MKKGSRVSIILVLLVMVGFSVVSAASGAGSDSDPLVSKSYVDSKIQEALSGAGVSTGGNGVLSDEDMKKIVTTVTKQMELIYGDSVNVQSSGDSFTPVTANRNQVIIGYEGTEIILRSGSAVGYVVGANSIPNITTGQEINNGTPISKNNLLIIPSSDNRGVKVTSNGSWFIVKGKYEIIN